MLFTTFIIHGPSEVPGYFISVMGLLTPTGENQFHRISRPKYVLTVGINKRII